MVWNELGLPFERSDEHKERRISRRIKNISHNTTPLAQMAKPSGCNPYQRTRITVYETQENISTLVMQSNEDIKLSKYEKVCSKHPCLPNAVCSTVSPFCTKRKEMFGKDFSASFKTVNKLKLNIGNVTDSPCKPFTRGISRITVWVTWYSNLDAVKWMSCLSFVFLSQLHQNCLIISCPLSFYFL